MFRFYGAHFFYNFLKCIYRDVIEKNSDCVSPFRKTFIKKGYKILKLLYVCMYYYSSVQQNTTLFDVNNLVQNKKT